MDMEEAGCGRKHKGWSEHGRDALCRSKLIVGVNQIAAKLM